MYTVAVTVAALVSGVLSAIATSLIASCIMWCVVLRGRQKRKSNSPCVQQGAQSKETSSTELVEYAVPCLTQRDKSFSAQDNVAYKGNISLQQNVAYEQVHLHAPILQ